MPVLKAIQPHHSMNVPNTALVGLDIVCRPVSPNRAWRGLR